jgi:hypothetical protein
VPNSFRERKNKMEDDASSEWEIGSISFRNRDHDVGLKFQTMHVLSCISWTMNDATKMIPTERIWVTDFVSWTESLSSFR